MGEKGALEMSCRLPRGEGIRPAEGDRDPAGRWPAGRQRAAAVGSSHCERSRGGGVGSSRVERDSRAGALFRGGSKEYCIGPKPPQFGPKPFYYLDIELKAETGESPTRCAA